MSRKSTSIIAICIVFLLTVISLGAPNRASAAKDNDDSSFPICDITIGNTRVTPGSSQTVRPTQAVGNSKIFNIKVCGSGVFDQAHGEQDDAPLACIANGQNLVVQINRGNGSWGDFLLTSDGAGCFVGSITMKEGEGWGIGGHLDIELEEKRGTCTKSMPVCRRVNPIFDRSIVEEDTAECAAALTAFRSCSFLTPLPARINVGNDLTVSGTIPSINLEKCAGLGFDRPKISIRHAVTTSYQPLSEFGDFGQPFSFTKNLEMVGLYYLTVKTQKTVNTYNGPPIISDETECRLSFRVCSEATENCETAAGPMPPNGSQTFRLCNQVSNEVPPGATVSQQKKCITCLGSEDSPEGIWTAVGCIKTEPQAIIQTLVRIGISIGGGIALLMTLVGGFMLTTSQGDPKRVQEGKEMITSSVIGIIFVLFSVVILQFIGVTILQLPGFGT